MAKFTYKSYNFVDKDPIIDEMRPIINESGASYKWISENSNVGAKTISNWFDGKTKRPQAATLNAVARSMGYRLEFVKFKEVKVVSIVESKPASMRHIVQMQKYKRKGR